MIECIKVEEVGDPLLSRVEHTYVSSFPSCERRDFPELKKLITPGSPFVVNVLLRDGEYVGFITAWDFGRFVYVEHFAIDESARNGGIGGKALKQFLDVWNRPVVLEVEKPDDEMSRRRIGFYERLGFVLDTHPYQQPPYHPQDGWLDMYLMSYGAIDLKEEYERVKDCLYKYVYKVK